MDLDVPGIGKNGPVQDFPRTDRSGPKGAPAEAAKPSASKSEPQPDSSEKAAEYEKYLEQILGTIPIYDKELKYVIDRNLDQVIVKVIDSKTDKVIKEIPPEEIQRLEARIREAVGLLIDKKI